MIRLFKIWHHTVHALQCGATEITKEQINFLVVDQQVLFLPMNVHEKSIESMWNIQCLVFLLLTSETASKTF